MAFKTSRKIECKRNARCCFNIRQRIRVCSFKEHRHTNFSTLKGRIQSPTSCSLLHLTLYIECCPSLLILIHDILEKKRFSTTYNQLLHPHTSIYKAGKLSSLQSADINVCSLKLVGCLCSSWTWNSHHYIWLPHWRAQQGQSWTQIKSCPSLSQCHGHLWQRRKQGSQCHCCKERNIYM